MLNPRWRILIYLGDKTLYTLYYYKAEKEMIVSILRVPKFNKGQKVKFIGGVGIIKNYRPESNHWVYLVAMPMKQDPKIDRIGYETMIWLSETDVSSRFDSL